MPVILASLWLKNLFPVQVKANEMMEQMIGTIAMIIFKASGLFSEYAAMIQKRRIPLANLSNKL